MSREDFELDKDFYEKIMCRMLVKRAAGNCWGSKFDDSIRDFNRIFNNETYCSILGQREVAYLKTDLSKVIKR